MASLQEAMGEKRNAIVDSPEGEKVCVLLQIPLPRLVQQLEGRFHLLRMEDLDSSTSSRVWGLVSTNYRPVDRSLLEFLPNLQIICKWAVGVDRIDLDLCGLRRIRVTTGAHSQRVCSAHKFMQSGSWSLNSFPLARKASGLLVGIVGLGQIGRAIAKRAVGFNCIVHQIQALVAKRLGAAGLDVFEKEPYVCGELMTMENVVLSPHAGSGTWETRTAVVQLVVDYLNAFFTGKPLLSAVI
ncbi:hypothetical protein GOP47_0020958 [Adiantum capillus-veneris]|uniref:D-isomer specific 2-hydroxyacid dehydrogenase NAD-binding domain-containing protein n=1 Tax=Adiantum capillus-veneris TaxID=13818 RepID=A0A9D4UA65_ADICA|nr:hypothetical protein GOP47_0020958 [Adiantum capillus-veneris]